MTIDELQQLLEVSPEHSCCVDIRNVEDALGYVRTITIHDGPRVNIEFDVWGMDEGGLYYWASFSYLQQAVDSVADYIRRPIANWTPPQTYPDRPAETGSEQSHTAFKQLLTRGGLSLPSMGQFQSQPSYWHQFIDAPPA